MLMTVWVIAATVGLLLLSLGLAAWSERQREARIEAREARERAIAEARRNHPSVVGRQLFRAA